jgi:hypothetical protein
MDEIPIATISPLPRSYREETRIIEETRFSIWFLRIVASLIRPDEEIVLGRVIEQRAHEFREEWEERELAGLFAIDCRELREALARLDGLLTSRSFLRIGSELSGPPINIVHSVHAVLRGHLEFIETLRMAAVDRSPAVARFIEIIGDKHKLDRDNHHIGWHYHYCKSNGDRSDTLLSFDTSQSDRLDARGRIQNVPLFWERHSESKARFRAKAHLWGDGKRRSVWNSVLPELERPLHEFRRPKEIASPVWPKNAVLSTRPYSYSPR